MASKLQIEANRKNAKKSKGPKTAAGKIKASCNALRHGLTRSKAGDVSVLTDLAAPLASCLDDSAAATLEVARAKAHLIQVRTVRVNMLMQLLETPVAPNIKRLLVLDRYERAALAKQKWALRGLGGKPLSRTKTPD